jgi:hypothetical protein
MDRIIVFEVKGTLRPNRLPTLVRGELKQLESLHPITRIDQLRELEWWDKAGHRTQKPRLSGAS